MVSTQRPFVLVDGRWVESVDPPAAPRAPVTVLTWNIWFGEHLFDERATALFAELAQRRPDVIALQEVTQPLLARLLDEPWLRSQYQVSATELEQRYDVVLLSRLPIRKLTRLPLPSTMGRGLVIAELANGLTVATVHLESMKESVGARATQLRIIQPALAQLGDAALVGDMNFKPDDEVETAALDPAFVDVWPALHPDDPGYTADSAANAMRYMLKPTLSRKRIDRVFVHAASWRATQIELVGTFPIDGEGTFVSDHFGLAATLAPV
jgi:endonuclease/exonuclease/phosphatase family metal-dependent hydrolase